MIRLEGFEHAGGHSFAVKLPGGPSGDNADEPFRSPLIVLENGVGLGPPHAVHALIREKGRGLFSHWGDTLYFSSSDNSDPRHNGREYHVYMPPAYPGKVQAAMSVLSSLPGDFNCAEAYAAVEKCLSILYPEAKIGEDQKSFWHELEFLEAYHRMCGSNYRAFERKYAVYNLVKSLH